MSYDPFVHRLPLGRVVDLDALPTTAEPFHSDRKAAEKEHEALRLTLRDWQYKLYAEGKRKLLVVLQALDAGGKDGTIRRVFEGVNPQGVQVTSFKVPTQEELSRDYLWRIHKAVPGAGMIGIFNRSHYEEVLVVRVENIVPEAVWRKRYEQINQFEKLLADTGMVIVKIYLHISAEEQKERLQSRLQDPTKNWKFEMADLEKRRHWDAYRLAFNEALTQCNTADAPWYVIPADKKWYRDLAISRVLVHTLEQMNPQYPVSKEDWSHIEIE